MMSHELNQQLHKLFESLGFQRIVEEPVSLQGGFLHQMTAVETLEGKYVVKVLNPKVMEWASAVENFERSNRIASIASAVIPALPAKLIKGQSIHMVDGQFFQVFDYIEGHSKKPQTITLNDCATMGKLLGTLHHIDFKGVVLQPNPRTILSPSDWQADLTLGLKSEAVWTKKLSALMDQLFVWDVESIQAVKSLSTHQCISHGDLDPKNILWNGESPTIIDWEFAGNVNPMQELVETAIYWAEDENHVLLKERVVAFVEAYKSVCQPLRVDWNQVLMAGFSGKLSWLAYNLKRSLGTSGEDFEERQLGTEQVLEMLVRIRHYGVRLEEISEWFSEKNKLSGGV